MNSKGKFSYFYRKREAIKGIVFRHYTCNNYEPIFHVKSIYRLSRTLLKKLHAYWNV